ncbi:MAG TPA: hypothetical protein VN666_15655 [Nitrospira sp.]|nr:hypothetical protein [Nitrospira sp.]
MRQSALFSILTLILFLLVPPVHAVNYTGEAVLNWNTLQFSGIPITISTTRGGQGVGGDIFPNSFPSTGFPQPRNGTLTLSVPHVGTSISSMGSNLFGIRSSSPLYASVNTLGGEGDAGADRNNFFTAMGTGQLTVGIDYTLQQIGQSSLPSDFVSRDIGILSLFRENYPGPPLEDRVELTSSSGDNLKSGTLSVTESYQRGDTGGFIATASVITGEQGSSVPVPDMLWPTLAGMIGIAFWAERRRCQARLTR